MARINLLPWRENLRKKKQRDFGFATVLALVVTAGLCAGVFFYVESMIKYQERRNGFLKREIAEVDRQIKEIEGLERTKAKLIARMNVIQELQSSRPQVVHLFDELVKTIPEGSYLTKLAQAGNGLTLEGRAQSNARVSTYMRNIDGSPWLSNPVLQVISNEQKDADPGNLNQFTLRASQVAKSKEDKQ